MRERNSKRTADCVSQLKNQHMNQVHQLEVGSNGCDGVTAKLNEPVGNQFSDEENLKTNVSSDTADFHPELHAIGEQHIDGLLSGDKTAHAVDTRADMSRDLVISSSSEENTKKASPLSTHDIKIELECDMTVDEHH